MAALEIRGMQSLIKKLQVDKLRLEKKLNMTHRKIVEIIFTDIVEHTPQWSGNLVSNWYIEFHGRQGKYKRSPAYKTYDNVASLYNASKGDLAPYAMGDEPNVTDTIAREVLANLPLIRWNSIVTITNKTPYAQDVENNIGPDGKNIRPENLIASYAPLAMVGYATMKYSNLRNLKGALKW